MKRHVIDRFRRRLSFEKRDRDVIIADCNAVIEIKFPSQPQGALEPFRTFLRIAHCQPKMANLAQCKGNFHLSRLNNNAALASPVPNHFEKTAVR